MRQNLAVGLFLGGWTMMIAVAMIVLGLMSIVFLGTAAVAWAN
jgi:hypothetical protein